MCLEGVGHLALHLNDFVENYASAAGNSCPCRTELGTLLVCSDCVLHKEKYVYAFTHVLTCSCTLIDMTWSSLL